MRQAAALTWEEEYPSKTAVPVNISSMIMPKLYTSLERVTRPSCSTSIGW